MELLVHQCFDVKIIQAYWITESTICGGFSLFYMIENCD